MSVHRILGIDFETANESRSSACAVGLCSIDFLTGKVLEKKCILIKPTPNYFDEFNVMIHGITPDLVANASAFPDVLPEISARIDTETLVVAHNSAFDMSVLRSACDYYGLSLPEMHLICTRVLSRVLLPGLASYSLTDVADKCGLPEFRHHAADDDAEACARILLRLFTDGQFDSLETMLESARIRLGSVSNGTYISCRRKKNASFSDHRSELDNLAQTVDPSECEDSPFFGMTCIFTGKLLSMVRADAEKLVVQRGGSVGDKVNADTNYLICGYQDPRVLKGKSKSRKLLNAEKLAAEGQNIQILQEDDFIQML